MVSCGYLWASKSGRLDQEFDRDQMTMVFISVVGQRTFYPDVNF